MPSLRLVGFIYGVRKALQLNMCWISMATHCVALKASGQMLLRRVSVQYVDENIGDCSMTIKARLAKHHEEKREKEENQRNESRWLIAQEQKELAEALVSITEVLDGFRIKSRTGLYGVGYDVHISPGLLPIRVGCKHVTRDLKLCDETPAIPVRCLDVTVYWAGNEVEFVTCIKSFEEDFTKYLIRKGYV